jgi:hypothetical protein
MSLFILYRPERHRWQRQNRISKALICSKCRCVRRVIAVVGIKYQRELKTYVRPDGVEFTGRAPECET